MQKPFYIIICVFVVCIGALLGIYYYISREVPIKEKRFLSVTINATPEVGTPKVISIPKIGVQSSIEDVGMDSQGRMDIPKNNNDVAWYDLGYKPGQKGSAVIDGHYDTATGAGAVFYHLSQLSKGDKIIVIDSNKKSYTFIVTDIINYPFDQLPLKPIFTKNDKSRLNLITCEGTWDRKTHNYLSRTVIYSELWGS